MLGFRAEHLGISFDLEECCMWCVPVGGREAQMSPAPRIPSGSGLGAASRTSSVRSTDGGQLTLAPSIGGGIAVRPCLSHSLSLSLDFNPSLGRLLSYR